MPDPTPDSVAAYLDGLAEDAGAMISAGPRLLAALDAVLELAATAQPGLTAMCICYDCERWGDGDPAYADYTPHPGRVMSWKLSPDQIRGAISAALLGKGESDAHV